MIKFPRARLSAALSLFLAPYASIASAQAPVHRPYGLVWLDVDPGPAEVALDGAYLDAGVWLISVAPGDHEVRVRKAGFRTYAARIEIAPGQSVHLDVRLEPGTGGDS